MNEFRGDIEGLKAERDEIGYETVVLSEFLTQGKRETFGTFGKRVAELVAQHKGNAVVLQDPNNPKRAGVFSWERRRPDLSGISEPDFAPTDSLADNDVEPPADILKK